MSRQGEREGEDEEEEEDDDDDHGDHDSDDDDDKWLRRMATCMWMNMLMTKAEGHAGKSEEGDDDDFGLWKLMTRKVTTRLIYYATYTTKSYLFS